MKKSYKILLICVVAITLLCIVIYTLIIINKDKKTTISNSNVDNDQPTFGEELVYTYNNAVTNSDDTVVKQIIDEAPFETRYANLFYSSDFKSFDVLPTIVEDNINEIDWYVELIDNDGNVYAYCHTTSGDILKDY